MIFQYGEERHSRRIARAIVREAALGRIETTGALSAIVRRAVPTRGYQRIDPATRTFQALRIWVNRELEGLDTFLTDASRRLLTGARLVVYVSFVGRPDREAHFPRHRGGQRRLQILTRKPMLPGDTKSQKPPAREARIAGDR